MAITPINVHLEGPYSWNAKEGSRNLFREQITREKGLYIWTIPQAIGELVYYVGITQRSFGERMAEHFKEHCAGAYHLNDPEMLQKGIRKCVWPGLYDRNDKKTVAELSEQYGTLIPLILRLIDLYRFYLAPIETDQRTLERIEAALARYLYRQPGRIGDFQEKGIYYKGKALDDQPIKVSLNSNNQLLGFPKDLEV